MDIPQVLEKLDEFEKIKNFESFSNDELEKMTAELGKMFQCAMNNNAKDLEDRINNLVNLIQKSKH